MFSISVDVISKWSYGELSKGKVHEELKKNTLKDENLDNLEKVIDLFKNWILGYGNFFSEFNEYKLKYMKLKNNS